MKKYFLLAVGLAAMFNLGSCSSDDDDNGTSGGHGKKFLAEITVREYKWKFGDRSDYGEIYESYKYDSNGNLTEYENNSGIANYTYKYIYDDKNRITEKNEYRLYSLNYKYKYQYNEIDSVSVMYQYNEKGSLTETHYYEYDNLRRLEKETRIVNYISNGYGNVDSYSYDGNVVTIIGTNYEDGKLRYTKVLEYDSHKNLTKSTYTSTDDGKPSVTEYEYEYDSNGRISKSTTPYYLIYKKYKEYTYNEDGTINKIHLSYSDNNEQSDLIYTYTWK